jgi:hypothetical protein
MTLYAHTKHANKMKSTTSVELTQKEANLLLQILETFQGTDKDIEKDVVRIYNKIFNSGLDTGFGK